MNKLPVGKGVTVSSSIFDGGNFGNRIGFKKTKILSNFLDFNYGIRFGTK